MGNGLHNVTSVKCCRPKFGCLYWRWTLSIKSLFTHSTLDIFSQTRGLINWLILSSDCADYMSTRWLPVPCCPSLSPQRAWRTVCVCLIKRQHLFPARLSWEFTPSPSLWLTGAPTPPRVILSCWIMSASLPRLRELTKPCCMLAPSVKVN